LGERVVVADEVVFVDLEVGSHPLVGQVEDFEVHANPVDATPHLEGIDSLVDEVAEQLGPRRLFPVRAVPDPAPSLRVSENRLSPSAISLGSLA